MTSGHIITQSGETSNIAPLPVARKETALNFFNAIFPGDVPDLFMYIWRKDFKKSISQPVTATGKEQLAIKAASLAQNTDIYFGLGLCERKIREDKRIEILDVAAIPGFWLDLDCLGGYHEEKNLPTIEQAWELIKEFPLEPSIIVNSGGGLHVYWLFTRLGRFKDAEARELVQRYAKLLQDGFIRRAIKRGFKLDNTADLARVLRVPGTQNLKGLDPRYGGQAVEVTLQVCRPDRRYDWKTLMEAIDAFTGGEKAEEEETTTGDEEQKIRKGEADAKRILEKCPFLKHCKDDAATLPEPHWKAMIDVIAWCKNGPGMVHTLSRPYPRYDEKETTKKIEYALKVKPRTCKDIAEKTGGEYCEGCKYRGKVNSPIALGMKRETNFSPIVTWMDTVTPTEVKWLWHPYIPLGKLTVLAGFEGEGKSTFAAQLAAIVSRGWPFPGPDGIPHREQIREPGNVLLLAHEDGRDDTIAPRLIKAGADMKHIAILEGKKAEDEEEEGRWAITLQDVALLRATMEQVRPVLFIIDPVQAYWGAKVNMNAAGDVRPILANLAAIAEDFGCAIVLVAHLNKRGTDVTRAAEKILGSIDIVAAPRSVLWLKRDPENENSRAVIHIKSNLAKKGPSIGFTIGEDGSFTWTGASTMTEEEALRPESKEERTQIQEAEEFLRGLLEGRTGIPVQEVMAAYRKAKKAGAVDFSQVTLKRAKMKLGLKTTTTQPYYWYFGEDGEADKAMKAELPRAAGDDMEGGYEDPW